VARAHCNARPTFKGYAVRPIRRSRVLRSLPRDRAARAVQAEIHDGNKEQRKHENPRYSCDHCYQLKSPVASRMSYLRRDSLLFLPRKLFQHVPGENAAGGKVHCFLHQIEDGVFSLGANGCHVGQINDQFARSQVLACISPGCAKLSNPGSDERPLHEQSAPRWRIGD
jgi:hypothetical protein